MNEDALEAWKKRALEAEAKNVRLVTEKNIKDRAIQLLLVAGHLEEKKLELATELAGGFNSQ